MARPVELFQPVSLEASERTPVRPLDSLSNFVIDELPDMLKAIREGGLNVTTLINTADRLAAAQSLRVDFMARQGKTKELLLARIDILMLQAAIINAHDYGDKAKFPEGFQRLMPGVALESLVAKICQLTGRPATLTYEDVVINNPPGDIRTFSNGKVGRSEADFYLGHSHIEAALEPAIQGLEGILANENSVTNDEITVALEAAAEAMRTNTAYTGIIRKDMPVEHFKGYFRQYLGSFPNGLRGPSGAFTARVPLLEYLAMGETIDERSREYQRVELQYFPATHQSALMTALENAQQGRSIRQMLIRRGSPAEPMRALHELSEIYRIFREVHMRAVQVHLPEVFKGQEAGTGGEGNVPDFLQNRIDRDHGFGAEGGPNDEE